MSCACGPLIAGRNTLPSVRIDPAPMKTSAKVPTNSAKPRLSGSWSIRQESMGRVGRSWCYASQKLGGSTGRGTTRPCWAAARPARTRLRGAGRGRARGIGAVASRRVSGGRAERDAGPRSVLVFTPEPVRLRAAPLLLEAPFAGGLGGPRRNPPPLDFQRSPELFPHALQREL